MIIIDHLPKSRVDNGKELSDDRNQLSFGVNHMPFGSSKIKTLGVILTTFHEGKKVFSKLDMKRI